MCLNSSDCHENQQYLKINDSSLPTSLFTRGVDLVYMFQCEEMTKTLEFKLTQPGVAGTASTDLTTFKVLAQYHTGNLAGLGYELRLTKHWRPTGMHPQSGRKEVPRLSPICGCGLNVEIVPFGQVFWQAGGSPGPSTLYTIRHLHTGK